MAIIAICGKGGTGKTTLAAAVISWLVKKNKGSVLAIDADPNANLAGVLGAEAVDNIVSMVDEISKNIDSIPRGTTKERYIEYRLQEMLSEHKDFDLLAMGRPEGPGCYCYINNLLRGLIEKLSCSYAFVVIDNEAGMEHLSRRTMRRADIIIIVSDSSVVGIRSAGRIYSLAKEMRIKFNRCFLVINRAPLNNAIESLLDKELKDFDFDLLENIPDDKEVSQISIQGKPISELPDSSLFIKAVNNMCAKII